jgi:hypothetical protein
MQIVLDALDTLALALTSHDHKWTDRERQFYEAAVERLTASGDCMGIGLSASATGPDQMLSSKLRPLSGPF